MSNQPAVKEQQQVDTPPQRQQKSLGEHIADKKGLWTKLIGDEDKATRFMASAYQAVQANPDLLRADRGSLLMALGEAAALGLDVNPDLGEFWLIPRKDKNAGGITVVNGQTGYKGLMKLARREQTVRFHVKVVRVGDVFKEVGGTNPGIIHEPVALELRDDRYESDDSIVGAYGVAWENGSPNPQFVVVSRKKLEEARARSGNPFDKNSWSNVWRDHFEAMSLKTAIRRLSKVLTSADDLKRQVSREEMREAGKEPAILVEQLRDLVASAKDVLQPSATEGLTSLPMPGDE